MGARSGRRRIRASSHLEHEEERNEDSRRGDRDRVARRPPETGRKGLGRCVDGHLGDDLLFPALARPEPGQVDPIQGADRQDGADPLRDRVLRARLSRHRIRDRGAHPRRASRHSGVFPVLLPDAVVFEDGYHPPRAAKGHLEMKTLIALLALAAPLALAAEEAVRLDSAPIDPRDVASLQSGARSFGNYCLNCHSVGMMRYHKLLDLGLTEQQVKDNLLFTADKIGELMNVAMTRKDAKEWFGTAPPDLSVIARARGPDWLYTYMRSFYRDPGSATGWNNMVFERVAMPHVLWTLSGQQVQVERKFSTTEQAEAVGRQQKNAWKVDVLTPEQAGRDGERYILKTIRTDTTGSLSQVDYDVFVRDLVNFMTWMAEPNQVTRKQVGYVVLLALLALLVLTYLLYKEFWKDVH